MHDCHSKYIISFWGAFLADPNICICMEFMDKGSLDCIYKKIGPIDIEIVGKVALAVLEGLTYLYDVHRIIHRGKFLRLFSSNHRHMVMLCYFRIYVHIGTTSFQISNLPISYSILEEKSKYVILVFRGNSLILSRTHSLAHQLT